jgi:nucleotide-binding universal stress UspA family protein
MTDDSYSNILVPYDGSKFSERALITSKTLAKTYNSILHLATIVDLTDVTSPGLMRSQERTKTLEQIRESIRNSAASRLEQKKEEFEQEGIKVKISLTEGSASDSILELIKKNNIELVVIGSQGLSGLARLKALGSVSRRISEIAECPVLIVR